MNTPIWHIAGIGAIGTLVAGCFHRGTHSVNLILKDSQQMAVYQHNPLTVVTDQTTYTAHPQAINLQQLGHEPIQRLICCVKAYDILPLLLRLKPNLHKNSIIILIHNGLGVLDEIKAKLPELRIIFGLSTLGTYLEKPFSVRACMDGDIYLGNVLGEFSVDEINSICGAFQKANLPFTWAENINHKVWEKFAINCSINLLTVLHACKNGDLRLYDEELKILTGEIAEVLSAYDVPITNDELFKRVTYTIGITASNYSSTYQDVKNNRPTELRYLNEYLVKLAQEKNIAVPFNNKLLKQFYTLMAVSTYPNE